MATVSEICSALASAIPMPLDEVKKYARALINSGDLPKAVGRSIPELTMQDRAKLLLAIAASERPSTCIKAMRDCYQAEHRFGMCDLVAGDVIAAELRELAEKHCEAFQKWSYSDIEVSRSGNPRVQFRTNVNLRHFDHRNETDWPEFIGGTFSAKTTQELTQRAEEFGNTGLPVSAFIPGRVLMALAFGSTSAAEAAMIPIRAEAWRRHSGDGEAAQDGN
jgi:hypothetical protein